ncbi:hypothetical protein QFZ20_000567 [Flavobacterium sp. W4I14]|nr:hypothetical protein [Flavobacterium sp. W4I14]
MKYPQFCLFLIVSLFFLGCKHDQGEFAMHDREFTDSVYPEMQYQQQLNLELQKMADAPEIKNLGIRRGGENQTYIQQLAANTNEKDQFSQTSLKEEHVQKLTLLRQHNPVQFDQLHSLLIDSDQKMIGFHVKATGSTGLLNPDLRAWAEAKIAHWTADLNEIQGLKK